MTEQCKWQPGDLVWLPGQVCKGYPKGRLVAFVVDAAEDYPTAWCPRRHGAAPDESKLRAACEDFLAWWDDPNTLFNNSISPLLDALRAALAETPEPEIAIEGPVQVGDVVSVEGTVLHVTGDCGERAKVEFHEGGETIWFDSCELTIVSRPTPAHTCGECRWWDTESYQQCRMWPARGAANSTVCARFEIYPPK